MLDSERYNTDSDHDEPASASRSPDLTGSPATSHGTEVPAGAGPGGQDAGGQEAGGQEAGGQEAGGQEAGGPGRRLLRRARKAVVRPAGPPAREAPGPAKAGSVAGHAAAGQADAGRTAAGHAGGGPPGARPATPHAGRHPQARPPAPP